jgi:hypothetical protein
MLAYGLAHDLEPAGQRGIAKRALASPGPFGRMVATSDFSGLVNSACALASAATRHAMDSLDRMGAALPHEKVKAHSAGFERLARTPWPIRLLGVLRHQALELGLSLLVLEVGCPGPGKDASEFRPGVGAAHIGDPDRLDARFRRLDPE